MLIPPTPLPTQERKPWGQMKNARWRALPKGQHCRAFHLFFEALYPIISLSPSYRTKAWASLSPHHGQRKLSWLWSNLEKWVTEPGHKPPGVHPGLSAQNEKLEMLQVSLVPKQKQRHRSREQICGHQGEKEGWEERGDWSWSINPKLTLHVKQVINEIHMCSSGSSPQSSVLT